MPLTKNALTRYKLINECLTNSRKRYWSSKEILEKGAARDIRISRRTFYEDLDVMRHDESLNYLAPIKYSKEKKGYHYTEANYSIDKLPLSEDEIETFELLAESFKRFRGAQVLTQVQGMLDKLEKVAGQLKQKRHHSPTLLFYSNAFRITKVLNILTRSTARF